MEIYHTSISSNLRHNRWQHGQHSPQAPKVLRVAWHKNSCLKCSLLGICGDQCIHRQTTCDCSMTKGTNRQTYPCACHASAEVLSHAAIQSANAAIASPHKSLPTKTGSTASTRSWISSKATTTATAATPIDCISPKRAKQSCSHGKKIALHHSAI